MRNFLVFLAGLFATSALYAAPLTAINNSPTRTVNAELAAKCKKSALHQAKITELCPESPQFSKTSLKRAGECKPASVKTPRYKAQNKAIQSYAGICEEYVLLDYDAECNDSLGGWPTVEIINKEGKYFFRSLFYEDSYDIPITVTDKSNYMLITIAGNGQTPLINSNGNEYSLYVSDSNYLYTNDIEFVYYPERGEIVFGYTGYGITLVTQINGTYYLGGYYADPVLFRPNSWFEGYDYDNDTQVSIPMYSRLLESKDIKIYNFAGFRYPVVLKYDEASMYYKYQALNVIVGYDGEHPIYALNDYDDDGNMFLRSFSVAQNQIGLGEIMIFGDWDNDSYYVGYENTKIRFDFSLDDSSSSGNDDENQNNDEGTTKVYYDNSESQWDKVYAYWRGGDAEHTDWPGKAMTHTDGDLWEILITGTPDCIIFSDYYGFQTADMDFINGATYNYYGYVSGGTQTDPAAAILYLKGDMNNWEATDQWKFTYDKNTALYRLENVTIRKGQAFKVADASWSIHDYGGQTQMSCSGTYTLVETGSNCTLAEDFYGDVIFDLASIEISFDKKGDVEPETQRTVSLVGTMNGWEPTENYTTTEIIDNCAYIKVENWSDYEFKIKVNGSWKSTGGQLENAVWYNAGDDANQNMTLDASASNRDVVMAYNIETKEMMAIWDADIFLIGDMNGWDFDDEWQFTKEEGSTSYILHDVRLSKNDTFLIYDYYSDVYFGNVLIADFSETYQLDKNGDYSCLITDDFYGDIIFDHATRQLSLNKLKVPVNETEWNLLCQLASQLTAMGWSNPWDMTKGPEDLSSFAGVTVKDESVTSLDLSGMDTTGAFPAAVVMGFPNLKRVNFSNCGLTGDLMDQIQQGLTACLMANPKYKSAWETINFSSNELTGNLGKLSAAKNYFPNLKSINISGNKFSDIYPPLPLSITELITHSQNIDKVVTLDLADYSIEQLSAEVPTIMVYDHAGQSYNSELRIQMNHSTTDPTGIQQDWWVVTEFSNGNLNIIEVSSPNNYYGQSGDVLGVNDLGGSNCTFFIKLCFPQGDTNFNGYIDITDLQALILSIFDEYDHKPFNFTAADLWADNFLNVQDVICVANILLANEPDGQSQAARIRKAASEYNIDTPEASVYVADGVIYLQSPVEIAALDVVVDGTAQWDMASYGFTQCAKEHHLIAYSLSGTTLPEGLTVIGRMTDGSQIVSCSLSDKNADSVAVKINANMSGVEDVTTDSACESAIYDIYGRPVHSMGRGLYIKVKGNEAKKVYNK